MKQGPFIDLFSDVLGIEQKSVRVMTRALRDAGFLTTGARGVNAPDMTFRDAANLTVAFLSGEPPSRIKDVAQRYLGSTLWDVNIEEHPDTIFSDLELTEKLTAGEFLAEVFRIYSQDPLDEKYSPFISVLGEFPPLRIEISESDNSLSVHNQLSHRLMREAHYLFFDFEGRDKFFQQFPDPVTSRDQDAISTLYYESTNKKRMHIARWVSEVEIMAIARAVAE